MWHLALATQLAGAEPAQEPGRLAQSRLTPPHGHQHAGASGFRVALVLGNGLLVLG